MKNEQWEFITSHWGEPDESILEEIKNIKTQDEKDYQDLLDTITERENKIRELDRQNIDLNKTNMNLVLRLTDPKTAQLDEHQEELNIPSINDLDAFVK